MTSIARLAGAHRSGRLPTDLTDEFPVDLRAAAVGEPPPLTPDRLHRRVTRLAEFADAYPRLLPDNVRAHEFLDRLAIEAPQVLQRRPPSGAAWPKRPTTSRCRHWNANVDNAWFWTGDDGALCCGLMDWGCVSQLNVAMAIWGAMSAAEIDVWDHHFDEFLELFCNEVAVSGGPTLDPAALKRQVTLYALLMGVRWLMDVPTLIRSRVPDGGAAIRRTRSGDQRRRIGARAAADAVQRAEPLGTYGYGRGASWAVISSAKRHSSTALLDTFGAGMPFRVRARRIFPVLAAGALVVAALIAPVRATADVVATTADVLRVVDGDTIDIRDDVRGRLRVRILGIDTPETKKPGYGVGVLGT